MSSDSWEYWHPRKEGVVEPEIPKLEEILERGCLSRILDFGCGTGRHTSYFARKGFEVYAERVGSLLHGEGLQADLRVLDMKEPLPYLNAFFDAVLATRVIHHTFVENIRKIVAEINRVLKAGGYVFLQVADYEGHLRVLAESPQTHVIVEPGTHIPMEGVEKGVPHHCFTREELLGLFPNYDVEEMHMDSDHYRGYCLIARKVRE